MGLFDDLLEEEDKIQTTKKRKRGLFDDLLEEEELVRQTTQARRDTTQARFLPPIKEMFKQKPKEIGTFEGIKNAARNAFASSQQALSVVGGVTPEEAKEISKIEYEKNARQVSPDYKEYQEAQGFDAVKAFAKNPFEVTTNIVAEGLAGSLPALGAGLAAGGVGAAVAAPTVVGAPVGFLAGQVAGTFAGSLATEYGGKVLEELQGAGMDINNPDSITEFFSKQELVDAAKEKALKRGVPIAAFDALSAGIGGKVASITRAAFKTKTREAAAEMAVQAALGGGGEVAGSLVAGDKIDPKAVFSEVVGEVGPGAAEIGIGKIQQTLAERRKQEQINRAAKVSQDLENNNAPLTAGAFKTTVAKNAVEEEKSTIEETDAALAEETSKFAPPEEAITKRELKTKYTTLSPEDLADTEATFRERLDDEDPEMRTFAQNALDAIAEVRAERERAKLPTDILPIETPGATYGREADIYDVFAGIRRKPMPPSGPAFESAKVIEEAARRADILRRTPEGRDLLRRELQGEEMVGGVRRATEEALATAPEPAEGDVFAGIRRPSRAEEAAITIEQQLTEDERIRRSQLGAEALREELAQAESLSRVAGNTATDEEVVRLARQGLVNIQEGQNIITPRGEEVMQRGGAPLPRLTPEERAAEVAAAPAIVEQAEAPSEAPVEIEAVHYSRTPMKLEKGIDVSKIKGAYEEESTFGRGFYAAEKADEATWKGMGRFELGDFRNEVKIAPKNPLIISPKTVRQFGYEAIKARIDNKDYDAIITRGWSEDTNQKIEQRVRQLWTPKFPSGKTSGRFTNVKEFEAAEEKAIQEIIGLPASDYMNLDKDGWNQNQIFIPPDIAPDVVSTKPTAEAPTVTPAPAAKPAPATPPPAAEAPAPEVAAIQRDVTKPEQMTPEEVRKQRRYVFEVESEKGLNPSFVVSILEKDARGMDQIGFYSTLSEFYGDKVLGNTMAPVKKIYIASLEDVKGPAGMEKFIEKAAREEGAPVYRVRRSTGGHAQSITNALMSRQPVSAEAVDAYGIKLPKGYTKQGDLYVYQPAPATAPTPAAPAEAAPVGIAVGNRVKTKTTPQSFVVEEVLPQSAREAELGEQYYSIRNERTGETQVVEASDIKIVRGKGLRKMVAAPAKITPQTPEETTAFQKASSNKVMARNPELAVAAVRLKNGDITAGEYADLIDSIDPFTVKGAESIPTKDKIDQYIGEDKRSKVNAPIQSGKEVEFRIDIPTYNRSTAAGDTVYAVTAHEPVPETSTRVGTPISYLGVAKVINPKMMTRSISGKGEAIDIAMGAGKFPLATVKGNYEPINSLPADINNPDVWTEVSYNPIRSSYFVDVRSKNAVVGGDEAIMVGSRVFVKNPQMQARPTGIVGGAGVRDIRYMAAEVRAEEEYTPVPEAERYSFVDAANRSIRFFGGTAPENFIIVNDSQNKDYEMKAGYDPETGEIILNRAYIRKGENIEDILTHELGHYIYSDPQFQKEFQNFLESMPDDVRAEIDEIVNEGYNKETNEVQIEERQVIAFASLVKKTKRGRTAWEKLKDVIKKIINRLFKTNIVLSDHGAMAVFNVGYKRFNSGERIIREMREGKLRTAPEGMSQMDRDYLAAVERGDMETAQRMVDEAAQNSGFTNKLWHGTRRLFDVFRIAENDIGIHLGNQKQAQWRLERQDENGRYMVYAQPVPTDARLLQTYVQYGNALRLPDVGEWNNPQIVAAELARQGLITEELANELAESGGEAIRQTLERLGYDSVIYENKHEGLVGGFRRISSGDSVIVFNPSQIKRADPVTYDDAGNVIPLSQRFQPTQSDIRRMAPTPAPKAVVEEAPAERPKRRTKMQNIIDISTGVKRPKTKLTVNEMTALKDQIKLGARKRREDKRTQREFAKDLTQQLREAAIRGKVRPAQLRAITSRALQTQFDNEPSILGFVNYANKVIENANYEKDLSDAKSAIKSAKNLAKQKKLPANVKKTLLALADINPKEIDDPGEFAAVVNEYLRGAGPVTASGYIVIPDEEIIDYLEVLGEQIEANRKKSEADFFPEDMADLVDRSAVETNEILNNNQERKAKLEAKVTSMAESAQIGLVKYENPEMTSEEKSILDDMKRIDLANIDIGNRKEFIRVANNILVNNKFFGAGRFASIAKGQNGAMQAAEDSKTIKRNDAMFTFLEDYISEKLTRALNLSVQSVADAFRNIAGKDGAPRLQFQMGMGDLARGQAIANKLNDEIANGIRDRYTLIERETGESISDKQGMFSMGVAANLIQIQADETEAEGIARMRKLILEDIAVRENSPSREDRRNVEFVKKALEEVDANTVEGVLENLRKLHPANYRALDFLMNTVLPEHKDALKEHDELFNNQSDNYTNPFYLPIRYRRTMVPVRTPEDIITSIYEGLPKPKQAPNSIKRQKYSTLPRDNDGAPMLFDFNLTKNVLDSLSSQITATYTNPAWQQMVSFLKSPAAIDAVGGTTNLSFLNERLGKLAQSRTRRAYEMDGISRVLDSVANATRRLGIGLALGGYGQFVKQMPDQMMTTLANVKDANLIAQSMSDLVSGKANAVLQQFSIGERGEIAGGTKWINQMEGNFGKVRKFMEEGKWAQFSDAFERLNNIWLFALKKSDYLAAGSGWLSYYRKHLRDKGIEFNNWDDEARLLQENDQSRIEAALYAEQMVDMYQGSSDPTKMASLSQRGQNGWENLAKTIFIPFFSFVIQQRSRIFSDARDIAFGDSDQKKSGASGLAGSLVGILGFHIARRFILPTLAGAGAAGIYAMLGVDMDEPDEEKQKEEANKIWRQFSGEVLSNIVVGGFGDFTEKKFIDSVNYAFYLIEAQLDNENVLNDKGEVISFDKYQKERSPLYRYTGPGSENNLGMLDIMPGQIGELKERMMQLSDEELAESLTPEERRVLFVAGLSEWLYTMRLNDADIARMIRRMNKDVIEQAEDREKARKRLQEIYK